MMETFIFRDPFTIRLCIQTFYKTKQANQRCSTIFIIFNSVRKQILFEGYIFSILTPPPGGEMGRGKKIMKYQAEEKG